MNEHLFKLTTQKGVKVGYLNLDGANPCYGFEIGNYFYGADEFEQMLKNLYGSDIFLSDLIAHPFVTKDKNGKDVFADDPVNISNGEQIQGQGTAKLLPKIMKPLSSHNEYYDPAYWEIELIEDKEDD